MPVTLDIVPLTSLDTPSADTAQPQRFVRVGLVEGIDITVAGSLKYEAIFQARQEVLDACEANPLITRGEFVVKRILLEAISDTMALARIIYETIVFGVGVPASTFVLSDGSILSTKETNFIVDENGVRIPIIHSWDPPSGSSLQKVTADFIPMRLLFPMRTIQIDGLTYGRATQGQGFVRFANDAPWPTTSTSFNGDFVPTGPTFPSGGGIDIKTEGPTSLPRGFWLLAAYQTRAFRVGGYFTLNAQAISNVIHDWSDPGVLQDTHTGKLVQPGKDIDQSNAMAVDLFSTPYEFGVVRQIDDTATGTAANRATGLVRVSPYPTCSFESIFGF